MVSGLIVDLCVLMDSFVIFSAFSLWVLVRCGTEINYLDVPLEVRING